MDDKFIFELDPYFADYNWWWNFKKYCNKIASENGWQSFTVINYELRPYGGRLITPKTYDPYLRFDSEAGFTMFVLRWS